jgi:hypothetical protein
MSSASLQPKGDRKRTRIEAKGWCFGATGFLRAAGMSDTVGEVDVSW